MVKSHRTKKDNVNHPAHYEVTDNGIECIDAIRAALGKEQFIGFLRGQIIKYTWRLGKKDNAVEDNQKAMWYSLKLLEEYMWLREHLLTPADKRLKQEDLNSCRKTIYNALRSVVFRKEEQA